MSPQFLPGQGVAYAHDARPEPFVGKVVEQAGEEVLVSWSASYNVWVPAAQF